MVLLNPKKNTNHFTLNDKLINKENTVTRIYEIIGKIDLFIIL